MQITDRKIIGGLVILQLALCLFVINGFPIALDEPFSIFQAQQNLSEFIPEINQGNNSPLHFILLHFWIKCFGISPIAVRSLSLLFSVLTIPILYRLGKKMTNQPVAILVVLFFIFSRFHHYHAIEARMYSLFIFCFTLILSDIYQIIFEQKSRFVTLVIWNVLLFYTHYLSLFVTVLELIILVMYWRKVKAFIKPLAISIPLMVLGMWPGLAVFFNRTQNMNDTWVPAPQYSELYGNVFRFFNNTLTFFILLLILAVLVAVTQKSLKERLIALVKLKTFKFISAFFLIPYLGMFIVSKAFQPVFLDRYILFTTIPLYLGVGLVAYHMMGKIKSYWVLLVVAPMLASVKYVPDTKRDIKALVHFVKSNDQSAQIYLCPPWIDLQFYYHYNLDLFKDYQAIISQDNKNIEAIYGLDEVKKTTDFILINSKEGYVKDREMVVNTFKISHDLIKDTVVSDLYQLYHFKLK